MIISASLCTTAALAVSEQCQRIISLSPTITDTLLSLGLEQNIIAGTRYDRLPDNSHIQIIGGMLDPNYEAITMLSPTIILADITEESPQKRKLDTLQLNTQLLTFSSLNEIERSIHTIGKICDIPQSSQNKINELESALNTFTLKNQSPNVLMFYVYEGDDHMYQLPQRAAGKSFHQDLLEAVGAKNAYQGTLNAPIMSAEGVLMLDPDVILLLQGDQNQSLDNERTITTEKIQPQWHALQGLSAVQNDQVYILKGEATFIASPDAIISTLESLSTTLSHD